MKFRFDQFLKSWDQFGVSVGLTIAGDSKFRSVFGGLCSLAYIAYISYWAFINLIPVFQVALVNT